MTPPATSGSSDGLWNIKQASAWLSVSEHALRCMVRRNQVPQEAVVRIGRRVRFRSGVMRAWVNSGVSA